MHMISMNSFTLPRCLLIYLLLFAALTFPYWGEGQVIAPNRQLTEVGLKPIPAEHLTESQLYGDYIDSFVPAVSEHLNGARSGWLVLWTNLNELGHPLYHAAGFSPAYAPSWVIAKLTNNPWRFITTLSLLMCLLTGLFVMLFCAEIGLAPFAGLVAGLSLIASPSLIIILPFPMQVAASCWTAGILWSLARMSRKPDLLSCALLAFCVYSLLITAVPQLVVFWTYILVPYGVYLTYGMWLREPRETRLFIILCACAVTVGAVLTLPIFLDLAALYSDSDRVSTPAAFLMANLPNIGSWSNDLHHLVTNVMPKIYGDPPDPHYPFKSIGLQLTPLIVFFSVIGFLHSFRKSWGWWLAIVFFLMLAFVHPIYLFAVKFMGFGLERSSPVNCILLPISIIVGYGVDAIIKRARSRETTWVILVAATCILAILIYGLILGFIEKYAIQWDSALLVIVFLIIFFSQVVTTRPVLIVLALILGVISLACPSMHYVDPATIAVTSPLIDKMRSNMPGSSRYAFVGEGLYTLPPDFNAELGIPSVHSYDSISPSNYHSLIRSLGGNLLARGRWNTEINPDFDSALFWMSDISLVLATSPLVHRNLAYLGRESGIYLYKVESHMNEALQVDEEGAVDDGKGIHIADPRVLSTHESTKVLDEGDILEFEVTPGSPSILVLSQKFYPDWKAMVLKHLNWTPAKTTQVNGIFQGVLLPQGVQRVRLEFKPFVRYAWIGNIFWLLLFCILLLQSLWRFFRIRSSAH